MNAKLMPLATGALAALAFAALPAVASAGEFEAHCKSGSASCQGTFTGGVTELKNDKGEGFKCTAAEGTATLTSTTSTGTAQLVFSGCKEQITGFGFSCTNTGTSGKITTNTVVSHLVNLESAAVHTPGILLTNINVTFTCAGFAKRTMTGNIIGHIETPNCNTYQATHSIVFEEVGVSPNLAQKYTQVTTTGTVFDLISEADNGGTYTTMSQTSTGTIHWLNDEVSITC